jgi:sugar (pentulose or hexulose) kinase
MRGHAERCGLPVPPKRIIATGGASSNALILKTMASIFGCPVYTCERSGTCRAHLTLNNVMTPSVIAWEQYAEH